MHTPATIFDKTEKDRNKFSCWDWGATFLYLVAAVFAGGYCAGQSLLKVSFLFERKTEITRFGVNRYFGDLVSCSLNWREVSGVEVDREHQKIIVTGTKKGKKRPISIVVKCPNGELDEALSLISKQLPASANITLPKSDLGVPVV